MTQDQAIALSQNRLSISGEVTTETHAYVSSAIWNLLIRGSPPITIYITSKGGNVTAGLDIFDLLRFYVGHKIGIVNGIANSISGVILQACDWRTATPHSRILVHHITSTAFRLDVARDPMMLADYINSMEADQKKLDEILVNRTGRSHEEIRKMCELYCQLPVGDALSLGLLDQVIVKEEDIRDPSRV